LNNSYFIYENCSKFEKQHYGRYSKGIGVLQFENFHLFLTIFELFFTLFTVYNLNDSYIKIVQHLKQTRSRILKGDSCF